VKRETGQTVIDKPEQLSLLDLTAPLAHAELMDEEEFLVGLAKLVAQPAEITLTRNRSTLISSHYNKQGVIVARVQHAFRAADKRTMRALARFIIKPTRPCRRIIDEFLDKNQDLIQSMARAARAECPLRSKGAVHDLAKALAKVKREYGIKVGGIRIGWSAPPRRTKRRGSIKFGSYCQTTRTIRVHPDLDSADVPDYFVEYIIYHELLHAVFVPEPGGGRRGVHTREFLRFEKKFGRYEDALAFEDHFVKTQL